MTGQLSYNPSKYDAIVIGLGSMGASALSHLADRGFRVLGIDRFDPPHSMGSHGGQSRIIRKAYFEHPDYIPLLQKAYQNWREIEKRSGESIYLETGLLYAGPRGHDLLQQVRRSASLYDIPLEELSPADACRRFPAFTIASDSEVLFEPEAGLVRPEAAIKAYLSDAHRSGAEIRTKEKVLSWRASGDGVEVQTDQGIFRSRKIVLAAGPWTRELLHIAAKHLNVTRQVLAWYEPAEPALFKTGEFPCWLIAVEGLPGAYYGFPILPSSMGGPAGLKVAYHHAGRSTSTDEVDRKIGLEDTVDLESILRRYMPKGAGACMEAKTCLYSNTPDEHFVIDLLPGMEDRVCMAWGFSGHGFKFVSVVGEILADLAMEGKTQHPIGFLSASRFKG
jgi:sarcosine oxidase